MSNDLAQRLSMDIMGNSYIYRHPFNIFDLPNMRTSQVIEGLKMAIKTKGRKR